MRDSTGMEIDPLSDILRLANAQSVISGGFTVGGSWSIRFPAPDKIKFFALVKGGCWLSVEGRQNAVRLEAGDVILLAAQRPFVLASDLDAVPLNAEVVFDGSTRFARIGASEDCVQIGGHVRLDPVSGTFLADVLPPLIHVRAALPQAAVLQWLLDQLVREQASELPGSSLASSELAQLMFVQILRVHLEATGPSARGWLRAISDKRLAPALRLMHGEPGQSWHLEDLARASAMSRTAFALQFKKAAGITPLAYLTEWRMRLAERALREENTPVATLAQSLGYTSESAFSHAFKRVIGLAPKHYGRFRQSFPSVKQQA